MTSRRNQPWRSSLGNRLSLSVYLPRLRTAPAKSDANDTAVGLVVLRNHSGEVRLSATLRATTRKHESAVLASDTPRLSSTPRLFRQNAFLAQVFVRRAKFAENSYPGGRFGIASHHQKTGVISYTSMRLSMCHCPITGRRRGACARWHFLHSMGKGNAELALRGAPYC